LIPPRESRAIAPASATAFVNYRGVVNEDHRRRPVDCRKAKMAAVPAATRPCSRPAATFKTRRRAGFFLLGRESRAVQPEAVPDDLENWQIKRKILPVNRALRV
jgi:hypothetical protein